MTNPQHPDPWADSTSQPPTAPIPPAPPPPPGSPAPDAPAGPARYAPIDPSYPSYSQETYPASAPPQVTYPQPSYPQAGFEQAGYPQTGYGQAAYPPAYPAGAPYGAYSPYGQPVSVPGTNGMAIAALVCSLAGLAFFFSAPVGAILGHVARRQIRESGEQGDGMALAGIIVGWIITGLGICGCVAYIGILTTAFSVSGTTS